MTFLTAFGRELCVPQELIRTALPRTPRARAIWSAFEHGHIYVPQLPTFSASGLVHDLLQKWHLIQERYKLADLNL